MKRRSFLASLLASLLPIPAPAKRRFGNLHMGYVYSPYIPLFVGPPNPVNVPVLITSAAHFREVFGEPSTNHPVNATINSDRPLP